jgi:hypothetical protein
VEVEVAADPIASWDPDALAAVPDDVFGPPGSGRDESEFWSEADHAHHAGWAASARPRRHRRPRRATTSEPATTAGASRSIRGRLAAAWAAEASARRALRSRPAGTPKEPGRGRKAVAGLVAVVALLVIGVAVADLLAHNGTSAPEDATSPDGSAGLAPGGDDPAAARSADRVRTTTASRIVDAPTAERTRTKPVKAPTAPKTTAAEPVATTVARPSSGAPAAPAPAAATPASPAPTTAAPKAPTPPPTTPTTAAPPAKPSVQSFDATAATSPGGACPALQWATTLRWSTTAATAVSISGLLEPTLGSLPGDGSRVVCRSLPGGPLGGWTLTATGPGGSTTATA